MYLKYITPFETHTHTCTHQAHTHTHFIHSPTPLRAYETVYHGILSIHDEWITLYLFMACYFLVYSHTTPMKMTIFCLVHRVQQQQQQQMATKITTTTTAAVRTTTNDQQLHSATTTTTMATKKISVNFDFFITVVTDVTSVPCSCVCSCVLSVIFCALAY